VVELELAKDYALRVKDMAAAEQASVAAAAHAAELKAQKQMLFDLRQETDVLLSERDKQLQQSREKHQVNMDLQGPQLSPLHSQFLTSLWWGYK
jgi:hypothetical protein